MGSDFGEGRKTKKMLCVRETKYDINKLGGERGGSSAATATGAAAELRGERGGSGRGLVRCGHEGPEPSAGRHLRVPQREVVEPIPGSLSPHARQGLAAAGRRQAYVLPQRGLDGESCEMYICMQRYKLS